MTWSRISTYACVLCCAAIAGCATDGGPVGTGISSSAISGNIVGVEEALMADGGGAARLEVAVNVSIDEAPGIATRTDGEGNFVLRGGFSGPLTLRFRTRQLEATQALDVPAGSTVVLEDIVLRPQRVDIGGARQFDFFGRVDLVDCEAQILLVNDGHNRPQQFLVRLVSETLITDAAGAALACANIAPGISITIAGVVRLQTDRTIEALTMTVGLPRPGRPPPVRGTRFFGNVTFIDCDGGEMKLTSPSGRSRIRLGPNTRFLVEVRRGERLPSTCSAIGIGDRIEGDGELQVAAPGEIDATVVILGSAERPNRSGVGHERGTD